MSVPTATPEPSPERILVVHNHYQQPGGEDQVFAAEVELLRSRGHRVWTHTAHNDAIADMGRLRLAAGTLWNRPAHRQIGDLVRREGIQVAHFHNTFPLLSPAVHHAAHAAGAAVVQTIHNFRLQCLNGLFFRDGRVCEDCRTAGQPWPGIRHACYRASRSASAVVAGMQVLHRRIGTWERRVDAFIALTAFARNKLVEAGLPADRIAVKPNFVDPDPGAAPGPGDFALYAGRLSPEKGVETLLAAWRWLGERRIPLVILGDGPLTPAVAAAAARMPWIDWRGAVSRAQVLAAMAAARVLVLPSTCYEQFPLTIAEACATGLPVLGSDLGGVAALIADGRTGRLFPPGDAAALGNRVAWAWEHPAELAAMRRSARLEYERALTAAASYRQLLAIYGAALERRHPGGDRAGQGRTPADDR